MARLDLCQHRLKAGAVIVYAAVAVINEKLRIAEMVILAVAEQNSLLRSDLSRANSPSSIKIVSNAAQEYLSEPRYVIVPS